MRERVLSGMRPTGALHLGHYHGALKNWVSLQQQHDCFFVVADWHALTTPNPRHGHLEQHVYDMVVDWLAAGIDPDRATLFIQSRLPEHAELFTLLAMTTPMRWLERTPAYKDHLAQHAGETESLSYGFLGYPLLQAADILIYRANWVPVGEDQAPHVELTREVARRFNHLYASSDRPALVEPQWLLTDTARLPGLDGQKMSKSLGNTIEMRDHPDTVRDKIRRMPTDPQRVRRGDAGDPSRCPVWPLHQVYTSAPDCQTLAEGCRRAQIGCLDCKQPLIEAIQREQAPWHEKARAVQDNPRQLHWWVELGCERARTVAKQTLRDVRDAMGLNYGSR